MSESLKSEANSEFEKVFSLLDALKHKQPIAFGSTAPAGTQWTVAFVGQPSLRHANRIALFKDFLDSKLPGSLEIVGAEAGSVVVKFAPVGTPRDKFVESSKRLAAQKDVFAEIAKFLGIRSIRFADATMDF